MIINTTNFKKIIIYILIGCLIIAALFAVVTVLFGKFSEVTMKVFMTLFMAVLHSLFSLLFIWDDSRRNTFTKLAFFVNTIFLLVILSFFTSVFGIWKIVSSENIINLYKTYFVIAFAALHSDILSKALKKEKYMDVVIYVNYFFIAIVVFMLQPIIYIDNATKVLGELYYRFLGAAAIIDGTLSILTIIFYKLYMHRHPEIENIFQDNIPVQNGKPPKKGLSVWVWILIIYLLFQIVTPLFFSFLDFFSGSY